MTQKVLVGTSGWGYEEWVGPFYPKGISQKDFLTYYSTIFYTNEINTTFYNTPSRWVVENWVKKTPDNFLFTAKIPKVVTHDNKLNLEECSDHLDYYLESMKPLLTAKKLLAFLIQLPPSFEKGKHFGVLREFIENWPGDRKRDDYYLVIEFRHKSWMDDAVFNYLRDESLTYCAVIEPLLPPRMDVTNDEFAYIRFHGYGKNPWFNYFFKEEEIKRWAVSIGEVIQKSERVGIYFNNHFSGYATKNSLMMMRELNLAPRNDPKSIEIFEIKKKSGVYSKDQISLDKFMK